MIVGPASPSDVRIVASAMRQRDRQEFMAVSPFERHADLVEALVGKYGNHPDTIVASWENGPVAVGGMLLQRPNVATLMFFATDDMAKIGNDLTRFIKQRLFPGYRAAGVHRIECASLDGYEAVHRWLEVLGLKREAIMPNYGRGRETFIQFAWVV